MPEHGGRLDEALRHVGFAGHDGQPTTVSRALAATSTDALIVLRRGRIVAEWYGNGMGATTPHIVFSVSKSICGALGGILAGQGLLDPDAPVIDYVPELKSSVYAGCAVRHLLDMAVGIAFNEDYDDPKGDVARYRNAVGWDPLPAGDEPIDTLARGARIDAVARCARIDAVARCARRGAGLRPRGGTAAGEALARRARCESARLLHRRGPQDAEGTPGPLLQRHDARHGQSDSVTAVDPVRRGCCYARAVHGAQAMGTLTGMLL